jgi:hypothetical protein
MRPYDNLDTWLLTATFDRNPEYLEAGQARDHESLNKLAEFLDGAPRKKANMYDETGIWEFWQALPLREAADLARAQALYYRVVERGGPGSNLVQEGLLGLICATENPTSIPFWVEILDFKSPKKRDNFRQQRRQFALAALARLAVRHDETSAYEALIQATGHVDAAVREQAVDYLGRCYQLNDHPLPLHLVEVLTNIASQDDAFTPRIQAWAVLRWAGLPVPTTYPHMVYGFVVKFKWDKHIRRLIEIRSEQTLADLQAAIQQSIGWDNDHLYTFYMSGDEDDRRFAINAPGYDGWSYADDDYLCPANEVTIGELGLRTGDSFLYLFDYGDRHLFTVQLGATSVMPPEELRSRTYPRLVDSQGEAPPQYPDWDDDEIWEIDEGEI